MKYRKRILFAFIGILFFPIVFNNILLFSFIRDREVSQKQEYIRDQVKQLASTVDYLVDKIQSDFTILSYRSELRNLRQWFDTTEYPEKISFFAQFNPLSILSKYYDRAFLIHPEDDIMVDLKNKFVIPISKSNYKNQILTLVKPGTENDLPNRLALNSGPDGSARPYLLRRIPIIERGTDMYLYIELSETFFKSLLDDIFLVDKSYVMITDKEGKFRELRTKDLALNTGSSQAYLPAQGFEEDFGTAKSADGEYLVSFHGSADSLWRYYYGFSASSVNATILALLLQYTLISLFILLVFSFIINALTKSIYRPVNDLVTLLNEEGSSLDEFKDLQDNIKMLIERNKKLSESLNESVDYEREALLKVLLSSTPWNPALVVPKINELSLDVLSGEGARYIVCTGLDNLTQPLNLRPFPLSRDQLKTELFQIIQLEGLLHTEFLMMDDRKFVLILSWSHEEAEGSTPEGVSMVGSEEGSFFLGLSSLHGRLEDLSVAYREALIALEYRTLFHGQKIIRYQDAFQKKQGYFYPFEIEQRLISFIKQLDTAGVEEQLSHFFETVRKSGISFSNARHVYFHLLDSLIRIVKDFDLALNSTGTQEPIDIWASIDDAVRLTEIEDHVGGFAKTLLEKLGSSKESPTVTLANSVKHYLDQNYNDRALSLDLISSELKYSISHMSSVFKETFGETIKDYITGLRLNAAKELLAKTEMQISKIGAEVGYDNFGSFVKIFKTYLGETPKGYRQRIRGK